MLTYEQETEMRCRRTREEALEQGMEQGIEQAWIALEPRLVLTRAASTTQSASEDADYRETAHRIWAAELRGELQSSVPGQPVGKGFARSRNITAAELLLDGKVSIGHCQIDPLMAMKLVGAESQASEVWRGRDIKKSQ
ncbi:MAG: hypothetical protein ACLUW6_07435 [Coriobacteriaceae bacterium]